MARGGWALDELLDLRLDVSGGRVTWERNGHGAWVVRFHAHGLASGNVMEARGYDLPLACEDLLDRVHAQLDSLGSTAKAAA